MIVKKNKATSLIITVVMLGVFGTLGIFFTHNTLTERGASYNGSLNSIAFQVALSGNEYAASMIKKTQARIGYTYFNKMAWTFKDKEEDLTVAKDVSFFKDIINLYLDKDKEYKLAYSGELETGNKSVKFLYTLKVIDSNACLNLNDPNPVIKIMLTTYFTIKGIKQPEKVVADILAMRKGDSGKTTKIKDKKVLFDNGILTEDEYNKVKDDLTCFNFVDQKSVGAFNKNTLRSLININTASEAVIVSVFSGLKAKYNKTTIDVNIEQAKFLAKEIMVYREKNDGFKTAQDLYDFFIDLKKKKIV